MKCCVKCFADLEIQRFIGGDNLEGKCNFCQNENVKICTLDELGDFIRNGFKRAYEHVEGLSGAMWDSEDRKYIGRGGEDAGESIFNILYWTEEIFSELHNEDSAANLLEYLIKESGPSDREKMQGANDELDDIYSPSFVTINDLYGSEVIEEFYAWKKFKHASKYYNRYFDLGNENLSRSNLLNSLERIFELMKENVDTNLKLYRARKVEHAFTENRDVSWYKELGPAPAKYASNNRMSPSGISYTYLADDVQTTIQEIRANNGEKVILGEFKPKFEVCVLDLSKKITIPQVSIFNEEYNHNENWLEEFISDFTEEISKPINDQDKSIEYIATQVLAEFIRKLGFEGIKFESSLIKGTFNYVLFCGPNPKLSRKDYDYEYFEYKEQELPYFNRWLILEKSSVLELRQVYDLKVLNEYTVFGNSEESFLTSKISNKEFYRFEEILEYLIELDENLKVKYKTNAISLVSEVKDFIQKNISKETGYVILVNSGLHFVDITIKRNLPFYLDNISKNFNFSDNEKEGLIISKNNGVLPVDFDKLF